MDKTPPYRPTIETQSDLEDVWRHLMGPYGFDGRSLWMLRIDDDRRVVPQVVEITECDEEIDPGLTERLGHLLRELEGEAPGGSWAFLVSRPGRGVHESDRMWARSVLQAGATSDVRLEMTHLATDAGITPLPPDELMRRPA